MANRYANLTPSKKISEDFQNINIGFDKVQQEMDGKASSTSPQLTGNPTAPTQPEGDNSTKIATTAYADRTAGKVQDNLDDHIGSRGAAHGTATDTEAGFMSPEDKEKLDDIEEGAEVNQNAFAKVNDVEAGQPSDTVTFKGGTGITVTSNPLANEIEITATGEATPGPHATSHLEHGSDPIPLATETDGGLMSAADKVALNNLNSDVSNIFTQLDGMGDDLSALIARIGDNEDLNTEEKLQIILAINEINGKVDGVNQALLSHKAETVSQSILVTEPFDQTTKTVVNLGFKPKTVTILSYIMTTQYNCNGFVGEVGTQYGLTRKPSSGEAIANNSAVYFVEGASNQNSILGHVTLTETGLEVDWTINGTLPDASSNRRMIILAQTHGEG